MSHLGSGLIIELMAGEKFSYVKLNHKFLSYGHTRGIVKNGVVKSG